MPKNKFQDVIYTIIMASVMVYGMVAYNIVLNTGSMQNWVFLAVFHEWPIMTVIAILLELVFVGKLAMKVAFRLVNHIYEELNLKKYCTFYIYLIKFLFLKDSLRLQNS